MPTLQNLLARGYFPWELPPPFSSQDFADIIVANANNLPAGFTSQRPKTAKPSNHNLARAGTLRRRLNIPNPVNHARLSIRTAQNWPQLLSSASNSSISLSKPVDRLSGRAIGPQHAPASLPIHRARIRAMSRYILKADVTRCYSSIYTHSIPWALHTKAVAKRLRHDFNLIGNVLDAEVSHGQDSQTLGIPIGPDTSFLFSEIVMNAVDLGLPNHLRINGSRHVDDYEFGCKTLAEAEETRTMLEESLSQYELALNPNKTVIINLPQPIGTPSTAELRNFQFHTRAKNQQLDLIQYFDCVFILVGQGLEEQVMKYAISRLSSVRIRRSNWSLFENLLFQCALVEPGTLPYILNQLAVHRQAGYPVSIMNTGDLLNQLIVQHAPLGHGSEVAWAIWGSIYFGTTIDEANALSASEMNDGIVGLLLLDASNRGLITGTPTYPSLEQYMNSDDLYAEQWLLSYEANLKNWLPSLQGGDHVASDTNFRYLKNNNVSFYNRVMPNIPAPNYASPQFAQYE